MKECIVIYQQYYITALSTSPFGGGGGDWMHPWESPPRYSGIEDWKLVRLPISGMYGAQACWKWQTRRAWGLKSALFTLSGLEIDTSLAASSCHPFITILSFDKGYVNKGWSNEASSVSQWPHKNVILLHELVALSQQVDLTSIGTHIKAQFCMWRTFSVLTHACSCQLLASRLRLKISLDGLKDG